MRASRLVSILLLLQARGRLTAQQIAEEFGVSVRTVYRDMESLNAAGIPLYGAAGHDGGYRLVDGYRTRLTGLTSEEADALFLAGLPGPAADLGLGAVLATTQLKLMAALPEELSDRVALLRSRFHLDTANWYASEEPAPHLTAVASAVWDQRRIRIRYRRWATPQEVTRTLEPYGLVVKAGRWYVVAGEPVRTYRVSQILGLHTLNDVFERPDGFDLAEHWACYLEEFDDRRHSGEALVRLSPDLLRRLPDLLEATPVTPAGPPDDDGRIEVTISIESLEHAEGVLLRLGADAEILAPPELRQRMAETVTTLAAVYANPPR